MIYLINLLSDDQIPVNVKQYLNLSLDLCTNLLSLFDESIETCL